MPTVTYDGSVSTLKSRKTVIPNLEAMSRFEALQWLIQNTRPRGYSKGGVNLRGLGGVVKAGG